MTTVLLIIHLMIAAALVGVVLLQRSEGGALGIGGGGGFMTGRGAANFLTRVTASLAAAFFATSLLLTLLASRSTAPGSIFDRPATAPASGQAAPEGQAAPPAQPTAPAGRGGILDQLQPPAPSGPSVPQSK
ncbi:MAG TPA: preprotein translocase subunit SecG [Hyphomicrobiaceae bacterium]|jgi:preprotein translocase subunit SecG|nr:preprotein translocase subunit SecG [Hyphomicrobiaceae bacterium]